MQNVKVKSDLIQKIASGN